MKRLSLEQAARRIVEAPAQLDAASVAMLLEPAHRCARAVLEAASQQSAWPPGSAKRAAAISVWSAMKRAARGKG